MNGIQLLVAVAIAVAIGLGYKLRINVGLVAIVFAYLIGCFVMGLSPSEVIDGWPTSLFFVIFSVGLFYNFAAVNGTMDRLAEWMLYQFRNFPSALYLALYLIATVLAGTGAGYFTTMAVFAPVAVKVSQKMNKHMLIAAQAVNWGACAGANIMTSGDGVVFQRLMIDAGYQEEAFRMGIPIFLFTFIYPLLALIALWAWEKLRGPVRMAAIAGDDNDGAAPVAQTLTIERPEKFTPKQRITLALIVLTFLLVLVVPLLNLALPEVSAIAEINGNINIALICIVMSVVALLLRLGDQKEVIMRVPWNTIIMISGMGMLMNVAIEAGLVGTVSGFMNAAIPTFWLPLAFCFTAGVMSFFSSTLSVVCPTLFPVVGALAAVNPALSPTLGFTAVAAGSLSTNISPFSSGGSLIQMSFPAERREEMFNKQIFRGMPITFGLALVSIFVVSIFVY
ncbi:MAG: SLC13 family permease [Trueperella sp.]|nr:SLC13 family permease [Trueperella sp.]